LFTVSVIYQAAKAKRNKTPKDTKPAKKVPKAQPAATKPKQKVAGALVQVPSDNIYIFIVKIMDVSSKDPNISCK